MRRLLVAVIAVALFIALSPSESFAQGEAIVQKKMQYGLKGGIDASTLRGDFYAPTLSGVSFDHRVGFAFGGFVAWQFNDIVAIQPEFLWVRKSSAAEASLPELGFSQFIVPTLDYIEIPLLVRFTPATEGSIDPIIYAGPSLGINVKAQLLSVTNDEEEIEDIRHEIQGLDFGIVVGGGIMFGSGQLRYSTVRYTLEGRLTTGYTDILVDEEAGASAGNFSNSTFAIMAGIIY